MIYYEGQRKVVPTHPPVALNASLKQSNFPESDVLPNQAIKNQTAVQKKVQAQFMCQLIAKLAFIKYNQEKGAHSGAKWRGNPRRVSGCQGDGKIPSMSAALFSFLPYHLSHWQLPLPRSCLCLWGTSRDPSGCRGRKFRTKINTQCWNEWDVLGPAETEAKSWRNLPLLPEDG